MPGADADPASAPTADEAYLDAAAALLDLPIRPEQRAEVVAAFIVLMGHARSLAGFVLPDAIEAAPRFVA